jgi:hypothetical protein
MNKTLFTKKQSFEVLGVCNSAISITFLALKRLRYYFGTIKLEISNTRWIQWIKWMFLIQMSYSKFLIQCQINDTATPANFWQYSLAFAGKFFMKTRGGGAQTKFLVIYQNMHSPFFIKHHTLLFITYIFSNRINLKIHPPIVLNCLCV